MVASTLHLFLSLLLVVFLTGCVRSGSGNSQTAAPAVAGPVADPAGASIAEDDDLMRELEASWVSLDENTDAPAPAQMRLEDAITGTFFENSFLSGGGFSYAYGGKSAVKILNSTSPGNSAVWAVYLDNDYSGANVSRGNTQYLDLREYRKTGSLTFWIKAGPGASKFMVGLLDNQGNGKKIQTKVVGDLWVTLRQGEWMQVRIPLKAFIDDGLYWDAQAGREIAGKIDWARIVEFRISINKDENKPGAGKPIIFYLDQIDITRTAKGIYDPDVYWEAFTSTAPEQLVTDFTRWKENWKTGHGTSAEIQVAVTPFPEGAPASVQGQALKVAFKPGDWFDAFLDTADATGIPTDWNRHYAISLWLYTDKAWQSFDFVIRDRDHEIFLTKVGAARGWNQILVPFRSFAKFPYYQPPEAKQNNKLDLDGITQFGIKPGGEIPGELHLAEISLTNLRQLEKIKQPEVLPAVFTGDSGKVIQKIPDIYGINVGLWAPELTNDASVALQKAARFGSVRYPGGLRSDEEDWEKTLKAKDANVDTDEFLDWCLQVDCQPMFTVNVGDGSPERAAKWVEYVNKKRKGPRVAHWEIGNEVYGNWHKYYEKWGRDGGVAYGKAVKAFVKAMKAVDPEIKITAIWMLTGNWNKAVFQEVADVVDGVNVHHYAQQPGSESDEGLLSVSSEADVLMKDVRRQVEEYGIKGKKYEIWLTEWNSVSADPGPQILQHVEGLFVADYLGHLAGSPIELANLWALYNGRDKRMGDYSVLSPASDPQGFNYRRPSYWAMRMLSNTLTGTMLEGKSSQEPLSGWLAKRADGKTAIVFVNKNPDTDYKTTLKIPGLKGKAVVETLRSDTSGGLQSNEPTGAIFSDSGPVSETRTLRNGDVIVIPKYSIVTIRFE